MNKQKRQSFKEKFRKSDFNRIETKIDTVNPNTVTKDCKGLRFVKVKSRQERVREMMAFVREIGDVAAKIQSYLPHFLRKKDEPAKKTKRIIVIPRNGKIKKESSEDGGENQTTRARTIEHLMQKLGGLKGKRITYKQKLEKKGLKNRIKKKQKLELRKRKRLDIQEKHKLIPHFKPLEQEKPSSESDVLFSKFEFTESSQNVSQKVIKDPKQALKQIAKKNEKIKSLESRGLEGKAENLKKNISWNVAIQKAEGIKIKDNVELLKKSIKKKEQKKKRSEKQWSERLQKVKDNKLTAQKKRSENIAAKKKEKKTKKLKRAVKKGRVVT